MCSVRVDYWRCHYKRNLGRKAFGYGSGRCSTKVPGENGN
uniref:Ribosomal RNA small subunit methyltransferase G-like n=1 Tax=Rhizophora mucronata TaxID=61149 RepID=A0A2P2IQK0_RHIMU